MPSSSCPAGSPAPRRARQLNRDPSPAGHPPRNWVGHDIHQADRPAAEGPHGGVGRRHVSAVSRPRHGPRGVTRSIRPDPRGGPPTLETQSRAERRRIPQDQTQQDRQDLTARHRPTSPQLSGISDQNFCSATGTPPVVGETLVADGSRLGDDRVRPVVVGHDRLGHAAAVGAAQPASPALRTCM